MADDLAREMKIVLNEVMTVAEVAHMYGVSQQWAKVLIISHDTIYRTTVQGLWLVSRESCYLTIGDPKTGKRHTPKGA